MICDCYYIIFTINKKIYKFAYSELVDIQNNMELVGGQK